MSTGVPGFFGLKAESNFPPVIDSVTLTELSPGNSVLFGNQSFSVDVVMTSDGKPLADKALKAYIDGTFNEPVLTDYLKGVAYYKSLVGQTAYAVDDNDVGFDGTAGSPTTSNFVSVALFARENQILFNVYDTYFMAVTDDNKLASSTSGVTWNLRDAGIPNAIFRKVQPLYLELGGGAPVFVACGQIDGGDYFLATCVVDYQGNDTSTFSLDVTLTDEVISLSVGAEGGCYAGTANELYYRSASGIGWTLVESGSGPYQYNDGVYSIKNGIIRRSSPSVAINAGITGGFDDIYSADITRLSYDDPRVVTGQGGSVRFDLVTLFPEALQTSTTATNSSQYYTSIFSPSRIYDQYSAAIVSGGLITFEGFGESGTINNTASLAYARDATSAASIAKRAYYGYSSGIGVFVGNGGQIIYAAHNYATFEFLSDLNFSSIDKYQTLTQVTDNTEYPGATWFVLDKHSSSITVIPTGESSDIPYQKITSTRFRGGSTTAGATRRYLQMINYAGAYNNVESLLDSDPGFTDQQTTGTDIPDIRFPDTYADQDGFINRFEDVVDSGATFTVELQASNSYGSDADSDTVTPS